MFYVMLLLATTINKITHTAYSDEYAFHLTDSIVKVQSYLALSGGNGTIYRKSGYPALPYYEYNLPAAGNLYQTDILDKEISEYTGTYIPLPYFDRKEMVKGYIPDKNIYSKNTFLPEKDFDIQEITIRGRKFYRLRIYPVKFNPRNNKVILTRKLIFRVSWNTKNPPNKKPFLFKNLLSGPFYMQVKKHLYSKGKSVFDSALVWFKIPLTKSGAYKIPYQVLHEKGLYATFQVSEISMYSKGPDTLISSLSAGDFYMKEVPIIVKDENSNGVFDGDDYIVFYGEGPFSWKKSDTTFLPYHNPYTDTTFYWLAFGKPGKTMTLLSYSSAPVIENALYFLHHETDLTNIAWKGLLWVGESVMRFQGSPDGEREFSFNIDNVYSDTATLRIRLVGGEGIKRTVSIITPYLTDTFSPSGYFIMQRTIYPFKVSNGENTFKVRINRLSGQDDSYGDQVYLDWYDVIYKISTKGTRNRELFVNGNGNFTFSVGTQSEYIFNINNPLKPYLLEINEHNGEYYAYDTTNGLTRYYIAKNLSVPDVILTPEAGNLYSTDYSTTDMLIITSKTLIPSLWRYKSYRETHFPLLQDSLWRWGNGNIVIAAVEDIYRDFGFGSHDPVSIRNFIYHVYENSITDGVPRLKFLMMVGDGTYDYRGIETQEGNIVPPYEPFETADINNYTEAIEKFYADMNDDGYPDLFYGRVPVRTSGEVAAYFNKIMNYEQQNNVSFYRQRILLVSDDERGPSGGDGEASWHIPQAEALYASYTPPQAEKVTVYETDYGTAQNPEERGRLAKIALINAMNMGNLIMGFYGHGNPVQMTHEMLFTINDVNLINTHGKPPLCVILTCKFGAFSRIEPPRVIAEDWVLNPEGVLGVIASPHATFASTNGITGRNIFGFALDGKKHPLGEISLAGADPSYFLLGDPSVTFYYPPTDSSLSMDTESDTLKTGELSSIYVSGPHLGTVLTEVIGQPKIKTYYTYPNNRPLTYHETTPVLFRGSLNKTSDTSIFSFFLPQNADTGTIYTNAIRSEINTIIETARKFHLSRGSGHPDAKGPDIEVKIGGQEITGNEPVKTPLSFTLQAEIKDSYGINLQGVGEEKGLYLVIDNTTYDLSPYFKYNENSYTEGKAFYSIKLENEGLHDLSVVAYDNGGNRSQKTFRIYAEEGTQKVSSVLIYPNPLRGMGGTHITFKLEKGAKVELAIYSIAGTLIYRSNNEYFSPGFNSIYWDGRDMFGDLPASGFYMVILTIDTDGKKTKIRKGLFIERR